MTPTPDTPPAAVEAMCERLDVFEDWLYAMDMAGLSEVQPNLHDTAAMLREVARERDRLNVWCSKEYSEGRWP